MNRTLLIAAIAMAATFAACSDDKPNTPTPTATTTVATTTTTTTAATTTTTVAAPTTFTLSGLVVNETTNQPIAGAEVQIFQGANTGRTFLTNTSGLYSGSGLSPGTFTMRTRATGYDSTDRVVTITNTDVRVDVSMRPTAATTTTTTTVTVLNADFTITPVPCTITGASATVDCTVDATPSTGPITTLTWTYRGITVTNNVRIQLALTCANTGASKDETVPVTLTVTDAVGAASVVTKGVVVVKNGACGFP